MWHWGDGHMGYGWMGLGWVLGLAFLALVVWLAVAAGRRDGGRNGGPHEGREETPEQIVKRRYARGEIDRETYERLLADLRK